MRQYLLNIKPFLKNNNSKPNYYLIHFNLENDKNLFDLEFNDIG